MVKIVTRYYKLQRVKLGSLWPSWLAILVYACNWTQTSLVQIIWDAKRLKATLHWRHNGRECVSNHQPYDCLLKRLFGRRSKKTSKLRVAGLCEGNSPGTGEFPAQMASNAENVSIWWRHHEFVELPVRVVSEVPNCSLRYAKLRYIHSITVTSFVRSTLSDKSDELTLCGLMTSYGVRYLVIIGLSNGLSPIRRQAIAQSKVHLFSIGHWDHISMKFFVWNPNIFIQENPFEIVVYKMSFCSGLNYCTCARSMVWYE